MSQIFTRTTSGNLPPSVPTQFTADDATVGVPTGNNFNLFSRDTTDNADNGIQTTTDANGSANHYTELTNRATGTVTTADATLTTIITLPLGATPGTFYVYGNVQAYDTTTPSSAAFSFSGGYRTDGAAATELGTEFHDTFQEAPLSTAPSADISLSTSGNNVIVSVNGQIGLTVNWNALLEYRMVN